MSIKTIYIPPKLIDPLYSGHTMLMQIPVNLLEAEDNLIEERYSICEGCKSFQDGVCKILNNKISNRIKISISICPSGKWGPSPSKELISAIPNLLPVSAASENTHPPFITQLNSAANAVKKFAVSGFKTTPSDIITVREAICRACPEWDAFAWENTGRCRKCKCATWAKIRMATEACPLGKWGAV